MTIPTPATRRTTAPTGTAVRTALLAAGLLVPALVPVAVRADDPKPPPGFTALFNGKDLSGWWGHGTSDPRKVAAMSEADRAALREKSLADINKHWKAENGDLVNDGHGLYLTTEKVFTDYELLIEYRTVPKADSGIYLKGTPQVQIWDVNDPDGGKLGRALGSGGLWNNTKGKPGKDPLVVADKPLGEWNAFRILQVGARTSVWLNDKLVVDHAILENYFDRKLPLINAGPIQLQTHGGEIRWRNIFLREIPADEAAKLLASKGDEGFKAVHNGKDFEGWDGPVGNYEVVDGAVRCKAGKGGTIFTKDEYADFVVRLEFMTPPGANNGLAIRYPGKGDTAYVGMCELQVLDDSHPKYAKLDPRQYHGSAYGMAAVARGYLRPAGTWNFQEVTVRGSTIRVELNGNVVLDTDLAKITEYMGKSPHPGKTNTKGHFGFAGHGDAVAFRNIRIKTLEPAAPATPAPEVKTEPKAEVKKGA